MINAAKTALGVTMKFSFFCYRLAESHQINRSASELNREQRGLNESIEMK